MRTRNPAMQNLQQESRPIRACGRCRETQGTHWVQLDRTDFMAQFRLPKFHGPYCWDCALAFSQALCRAQPKGEPVRVVLQEMPPDPARERSKRRGRVLDFVYYAAMVGLWTYMAEYHAEASATATGYARWAHHAWFLLAAAGLIFAGFMRARTTDRPPCPRP